MNHLMLSPPILFQAQEDDFVLFIVYTCLKQNQRPYTLTSTIKSNSFLYSFWKTVPTFIYWPQLTSHPKLYTQLSTIWICFYRNSTLYLPKLQMFAIKTFLCCLWYNPFTWPLRWKTLNLNFQSIPHLSLLFTVFIHNCIEGQTNKHFPNKSNNITPPLPFYENATHSNYRISLDTKRPISFFTR